MLAFILVGCNLTSEEAPVQPGLQVDEVVPSVTPLPFQTAGYILDGLCFEALLTLDDQRRIIRDVGDFSLFYNNLATACGEETPALPSVDFATQQVVVVGELVQACDASFTATDFTNGIVTLNFMQSGSCAYDVVAVFIATFPQGDLQVSVNGT